MIAVGELLVYGSEDCLGWQEISELIETLRNEPRLDVSVTVRDPLEHRDEFQEKGLVICPSFLYEGELIAVGPPDRDELLQTIDNQSG